jgi:hypothetical protein
LVEVFALANTGQVWHRWQTDRIASTYTAWVPLEGLAVSTMALARNGNGAIELFGVSRGGQLYNRTAASGVNNWLNVKLLDSPPGGTVLRSVAAETNADGRVELFGVSTTGQIWHRWQVIAGVSSYSSWFQLDGQLRP